MSNSNSAKMTVEEKVVQSIKTTGLATLLDDEDAIGELVKRALHQALFERVVIKNDYYGKPELHKEPISIEIAREVATEFTKKIIREEMKRIENDPELRNKISSALMQCMPAILSQYAHNVFDTVAVQGAREAMAALSSFGVLKDSGGNTFTPIVAPKPIDSNLTLKV